MSQELDAALEVLLRAARETATARRIGGDSETALLQSVVDAAATIFDTFNTDVDQADVTVADDASVNSFSVSSSTFTIQGEDKVELSIPALEKGSFGWYEATVVNNSDTAKTVTTVRFDMSSDPDWALDTTNAVPSTTWADSGNDILWTGTQVVPAWTGYTFKVQARHNKAYTTVNMKVTATMDGSPLDSREVYFLIPPVINNDIIPQ